MSQDREFPLASLRHFLLPGQTVRVRTFMAEGIESLDQQINAWVRETKAIVTVPGPVSLVGENTVSLALTYVPAVEM